MVSPSLYNPYESSLTHAKTVVSLEWLYDAVRKNVSKVFVAFLVVLVGLPIVFLLGFWLKAKRKNLQRHMRSNLPLFKNPDEYLAFRDNLSKLDSLMPSLKKVSNYNAKKAPWPLGFTLRQMQKMTSTLATYNAWLHNRLDLFNEEQLSSTSTLFKLVPESKLWKERNQAYKYWM
jgi:hypothetical protein